MKKLAEICHSVASAALSRSTITFIKGSCLTNVAIANAAQQTKFPLRHLKALIRRNNTEIIE